MTPDVVGWAASAILLATLGRQVHAQSRDANAAGVSHGLYAGQILASSGFIVYSAVLRNAILIVTNTRILLAAVVGHVVKRQDRNGTAQRSLPSGSA